MKTKDKRYQPREGTVALTTPFLENKEIPLSEQPRPQFARKSYTILNGAWDYAIRATGEEIGEYDGKILTDHEPAVTLQAIEPMSVVRDVLNDADDTKYIVFVLCAVILVMNIMIISIITLLNMYHSAKEIALMRLIGISMAKINLLYIIQNSLMGLCATALAFGVSRICMVLMNDYVESMGVVLNMSKVYPAEFLILLVIFAISVLPTVIWTFSMSKKDSITG